MRQHKSWSGSPHLTADHYKFKLAFLKCQRVLFYLLQWSSMKIFYVEAYFTSTLIEDIVDIVQGGLQWTTSCFKIYKYHNNHCVAKNWNTTHTFINISSLAIIGKQVWMGCECKSLNGLLWINFNLFMIMTGPLLSWIEKMAVQHFTLEV